MKNSFRKRLTSILAASALFLVGVNINNNNTEPVQATTKSQLPYLKYKNKDIITVNGNKPQFSKSTLSNKKGAWQKYGNLDYLNRATSANALLNKSLMPTSPRESLYWDPTGWHNKKVNGQWLYNRCHLIGYQLTGQNNNPKNLITGTRQLNDPDMLKYEDEVADYVKSSNSHYVRYRVTPIFKSNELLARGVQMEGKSIGSNAVRFNVYIFNVQPGVKLNYKDGTSTLNGAKRTAKKATRKRAAKKRTYTRKSTRRSGSRSGKINTASTGRIVGNRNTKIYHVPGQAGYHMNSSNAVYFKTEAQARAAGYRKSLR